MEISGAYVKSKGLGKRFVVHRRNIRREGLQKGRQYGTLCLVHCGQKHCNSFQCNTLDFLFGNSTSGFPRRQESRRKGTNLLFWILAFAGMTVFEVYYHNDLLEIRRQNLSFVSFSQGL